MTNFPRGRGRVLNVKGRAVIAAWCPLCAREHRYDKGVIGGGEIEQVRRQGFTDEWLPCQHDLPGNFWRVILGGPGRRRPGTQEQRAREQQ